MIPKKIHYCWFGYGKKPAQVKQCIDSWKKVMPDYEIVEWNESNFDIHCSNYVKEAYEARKYAFVSDIARIRALRQQGGIYLDTDVEVYKRFDDLLDARCVLGFEEGIYVATSFMACEANHPLFEEFEALYKCETFNKGNGEFNTTTNVQRLTNLLEHKGLKRDNRHQILVDGIQIYPQVYFSPYDYTHCIYNIESTTYCVHHFFVSWSKTRVSINKFIKTGIIKMFGKEKGKEIVNLLISRRC